VPFLTRRKKTGPSARVCWRSGQYRRESALQPAVKPSDQRDSTQPKPQKEGGTSEKVEVEGGG